MRHTIFLVFAFVTLGCSTSHVSEPDCACPLGDAEPGACGGPSGVACGAGEYCDAAGCGVFGVCRPSPEVCPGDWDPVCGCDGRTYSNACAASSAGATVARLGECETPIGACGTRGAPACPSGSYCRFGPGCGAADEGGVCVPTPSVCPDLYAPVCGCDGSTYGNACEAAARGVSVVREGECAPPECAAQDARIVDPACDTVGIYWDGSLCQQLTGCCAGADCGASYPSLEACRGAHRACDRPCGGWVGPTCLSDELCDFSGDGCDWADASGVCRPRPTECPEPGGVPVCGCDGVEYLSECSAHLAGTDVAYVGGCPIPG